MYGFLFSFGQNGPSFPIDCKGPCPEKRNHEKEEFSSYHVVIYAYAIGCIIGIRSYYRQ